MSNHHRLTRRKTESILDAPVESATPLGGLLGALRAPGRRGELRREDAAVAAFHTARLSPVSNNRSVMTTPGRAATRAAIATGIVVTLTSGGFALAATGNLPSLPGQASHQAGESVAKDRPSTNNSTSPADVASPAETRTPAEDVSPTESSAPTPSFEGLCMAPAEVRDTGGKSSDAGRP